MSSRFVSAGSFDVEAGVALPAVAAAAATTTTASKPPPLASTKSSAGVDTTASGRPASKSVATAAAPLSSLSPPPPQSTKSSFPAATPESASSAVSPQAKPESSSEQKNPTSAAWAAVEAQLAQEREAKLRAKQAASSSGEAEKSLYEVLQANKAAKQAAFEEANKIKNQFRALDEDEIDFLDEVLMRKRAEEQRIKRETEERLDLFRRAQVHGQEDDDGLGDDMGEEELMVSFEKGRKRRRKGGSEADGKGNGKRMLVRRKVSGDGEREEATVERSAAEKVSSIGSTTTTAKAGEDKSVVGAVSKSTATTSTSKTGTSASSGDGLGGLVGYGSSDEDDD